MDGLKTYFFFQSAQQALKVKNLVKKSKHMYYSISTMNS